MSDIKVRVGAENKIRAIPIGGVTSLASLSDVDIDISNLGDGYVLVYNDSTKKWTATNILTPEDEQNLIINGGNF